MTTYTVSSGVTSSGIAVSAGQSLQVNAGGTAISPIVNSGGSAFIFGSAIAPYVASVGEETVYAGGVVSGGAVVYGGNQFVSSGGVDTATSVGGSEFVFSGGIDRGMIVDFGTENVFAGGVASATVLTGYDGIFSDAGTENVFSGGEAVGTLIDGAGLQKVSAGGLAIGALVSGGEQNVSSGGLASGTLVTSFGQQNVFSGGIVSDTTLQEGRVQVYGGMAIGTLVGGSGFEILTSGGVASGAVISNNGTQNVQSSGVASGTVILTGGLENVYAGGVADGAVVSNGGTQFVYSGGVANATTVNSGGIEHVISGGQITGILPGGIASGTLVNSGGSVTVASGGVTIGAVINSGGAEAVSSGGVASATMLSGGLQYVSSGGVASGTVVNNNGTEFVFGGGGAIGSQVLQGRENVYAGAVSGVVVGSSGTMVIADGLANGTVVNSGGIEQDFGHGVASGTVVNNGGTEQVLDNGSATGGIVNGGGFQIVSAGGVARGTVIKSGGQQTVSSGGNAINTVVDSGGGEIVYSGGEINGTLLNGGGSLDIAGLAFASGGSAVFNAQTDVLTVTEGGGSAQLQLAGNYASATFQLAQDGSPAGTLVTVSGAVAPAPVVTSVTASPATGDLTTGETATLTIAMSEAVTVSGGTPSLSLNDGGTATYDAAHSIATSLVFDYPVLSGQSAAPLAVTGFNAGGATIQDATGDNASFAGATATFNGLGVNVPAPTAAPAIAAPGAGNLTSGAVTTLMVQLSNAVTVSGGTPSLSLNDGGAATYDAARSLPTQLVFDYTVQPGQTTTALAVTGYNANGATVQDAYGDNANFTNVPATFSGLQINIATDATVSAAYTAILRTQPTAGQVNQTVAQIQAGQLTLAQYESGLITGEQALYTTMAALVTIDAFYDATPNSADLTNVAAATSGTSFYTAAELHNLGYSDPNVWTILGASWGADPNASFFARYDADATGTTSGYTAFINAVYAQEFGAAPTATNLQYLLNDVPGLSTLLSGGGHVATPIQIMGGLYGYLLYAGQTNNVGIFAAPADAFLQAAANGTVTYGPGFPAGIGGSGAAASAGGTQATVSGAMAADPTVVTITGSGQLIDPGTGDHTIQFLAGANNDTLTLHGGGVDQVSGFDPGSDALDLRALLSAANVSLNDNIAALGNYISVADQGSDALLRFDPSGLGGGTTIAVLQGLGQTVTGLNTLIADHAVRTA